MRTDPLTVPGLAGPLVVTANLFTGRHSVEVGGRPAHRTGRHVYDLPTADGRTVPGRVRVNAFDTHPTIEIAGTRHRTGPALPLALRILALLPLALIAVGGVLGGLVGAAAVVTNFALLRSARPTVTQALLVVAVLVGAVVTWLVLAVALATALG